MKKLSYTYRIALGVLMALMVQSCADDFLTPGEEIVRGEPAIVNLELQVGEAAEVSRADMAAGRDTEINSLWLGFFNEAGVLVDSREFGVQGTRAEHVSYSLKDISLNSGRYYIAAVANPDGNLAVAHSDDLNNTSYTNLIDLLRQVQTYSQYKGIAVTRGTGEIGFIDTPAGNLPMQGVFVPSGSSCPSTGDGVEALANTLVYIRPSSTAYTLDGVIHFRRLVSQVKFNITYDSKALANFEILQARVFNMPTAAWLAERADRAELANAGDVVGILGNKASDLPYKAPASANYLNSARILPTAMTKSGEVTSFDFWQLENKRRSSNSACTSYSQREAEFKDASGLNTGVYTALSSSADRVDNANNATFVELRVRMDIINPGTYQKVNAEAIYTIHLGYCEPKSGSNAKDPQDFNVRRNHKYTYNVNIKGINSIIVEACREGEPEHGAEGAVTRITTKFYEADSHYQVFNVQLSNVERASANWQMRVYKSQMNYVELFSEGEAYKSEAEKYWKWIEIAPTTGEDILADYKPVGGTGSRTFHLDQLNNIKEHPGANGNTSEYDTTQQWYTVYLNEYVYEDGDGSVTPSWPSYVNLPARTFWLKVEEERSTDKESVIFTSKYAIRQKSIQTYYGNNPYGNNYGIGLEHLDETKDVYIYAGGIKEANDYDSRSNNLSYIRDYSGKKDSYWNDFIKSSSFHTVKGENYNIPALYNYVSGLVCLSRNRDLNGNGILDNNEVRWFLPSIKQYVMFAMGSAALTSPLFDFSQYSTKDTTPWVHYFSIDNKTLWAEEYMSTGPITNDQYYPNTVRCARYLGDDDLADDYTNVEEPAFKLESNNVISFQFSPECIRGDVSTAIPWHYINSLYNRPPKKIEIYVPKEDDLYVNQVKLDSENWFNFLDQGDPCASIDKGSSPNAWRVPNLVEASAILFSDFKLPGGYKFMSVSREFFGLHRDMGTNNEIVTAGGAGINSHICVRDVSVIP